MIPIDDGRPVEGLDPEIDPPRHLRRRIEQSLRAAELLAPERPRHVGRLVLVALVAAGLLAVGVGIGASGGGAMRGRPATGEASGSPGTGPRYVLLLYGGHAAEDSMDEGGLRAEYAEWAEDLRGRGVRITGEELGEEAVLLDGPGTHGELITRGDDRSSPFGLPGGYFVVSAADRAEALAIAASCPHLHHGGRIVVRPIIPT